MDRENARLFISLANFVLNQAALQASLVKMVLAFHDSQNVVAELRDRMSRLPAEDVQGLRDELDAKLRELKIGNATSKRLLLDALAGAESNHEKLEAAVETIRKSLEDSSGSAGA